MKQHKTAPRTASATPSSIGKHEVQVIAGGGVSEPGPRAADLGDAVSRPANLGYTGRAAYALDPGLTIARALYVTANWLPTTGRSEMS
jgi:hypothetical protein